MSRILCRVVIYVHCLAQPIVGAIAPDVWYIQKLGIVLRYCGLVHQNEVSFYYFTVMVRVRRFRLSHRVGIGLPGMSVTQCIATAILKTCIGNTTH